MGESEGGGGEGEHDDDEWNELQELVVDEQGDRHEGKTEREI